MAAKKAVGSSSKPPRHAAADAAARELIDTRRAPQNLQISAADSCFGASSDSRATDRSSGFAKPVRFFLRHVFAYVWRWRNWLLCRRVQTRSQTERERGGGWGGGGGGGGGAGHVPLPKNLISANILL